MEQREARRVRGAAGAAGVFGVAAALAIAPSAAYADDQPGTVAPPGTSSAAALTVGDLLAVSETTAEASGDGGTAGAGVIVLNGSPILGTGGTQQGAGRTDGALLDTGATPIGRVVLAGWEAEVVEGQDRTARGRASALEAYVLDEDLVTVVLLESESEATHSGGRSTGSASSDAARVRALDGAVDVTVLHSEASSENGSSAYLVSVNGTEIGSDEQLGAICSLAVPNVATVGCLTAEGGTATDGSTSGDAAVVGADVIPVPLDTTVLGAAHTGGQAPPAVQAPPREAGSGSGGNAGSGTRDEAGDANETGDAQGALPATGASAARTAAVAAAALAAGAWLQVTGRLRRRGATA